MALKVSIVTSLYNHKQFLRRRAESIFNQTLREFEWIIIDDCSTDGSYEYIRQITKNDSRVQVIQNAKNEGTTTTSQKGFDLAQGEFLYRADSDDYCAPNFLERLSGLLDANPGVGMAHCRGLYLNTKDVYWGGWPKQRSQTTKGIDEFRRMIVKYHIKAPTILFRRKHLDQAGRFDILPLKYTSDWHLSLRVCLVSDVLFVDEPLAYYRHHSSNLTSNPSWQLNAKQIEIEYFCMIDDALNRASSLLDGEAEKLRRTAYRLAAHKLTFVIHWAQSHQRHEEAEALIALRQLYVPDYNALEFKTPLSLQLYQNMGSRVVKLMTQRKLPKINLDVPI